jgi:hypothetical protein
MIFSTSIILPVKQASAFTKAFSVRSEHPAGIYNFLFCTGVSLIQTGMERSSCSAHGVNLKRSLSQDSLIESAAMIGQ